jgi:hypothetical protein
MSSFQNCIGPLFEGSVISIPGARNFGWTEANYAWQIDS